MKVIKSLPPKGPYSTTATPKMKAEEHPPTRVTSDSEDGCFIHSLLPAQINT